MITRDAINNAWERFRSSLSIHDREQGRDLKELAEGLLAERDTALAKAAAIKEKYITHLNNCLKDTQDWRRIVEAGEGGK